MVNKLVLCLDYNNICFRSLYTCKYTNSGEVSDFSTDYECVILARKLLNDIVNIVDVFHPSEVFIAQDAKGPWRNNVCDDYKGTRVKDTTLNWDNIFKTMYDVSGILAKNGYNVVMVPHAEADDIAAMLKAYFIKSGDTSMVYVSSDADWQQLISFNSTNEQFFAVYNPISTSKAIRRFFLTHECLVWLHSTGEFFRSESPIKASIRNNVVYDNKVELVEIDPNKVLLTKIMCGDDGDNVPSFYDFMSKSGKKVRVTEKKMEKIFEKCGNPTNINSLIESVQNGNLKTSLCEVFKRDEDELDFNLRLNRQRLSVELDPSLFPQYVQDGFDMALNNIYVYKTQYVPSTDVKSMVNGTKYAKVVHAENNARLNSIFKTLVDKPIIHFTY